MDHFFLIIFFFQLFLSDGKFWYSVEVGKNLHDMCTVSLIFVVYCICTSTLFYMLYPCRPAEVPSAKQTGSYWTATESSSSKVCSNIVEAENISLYRNQTETWVVYCTW